MEYIGIMNITLSNEQLIEKLKDWNPDTPIYLARRSGGGFDYAPIERVDVAYLDEEISVVNPPIIRSSSTTVSITVAELIYELKRWPGDFPAFIDISDLKGGRQIEYIPVQNVDVYDSSLPASENNLLGVEAGDSSWLGGEDWATYPFPGSYLGS